MHVPACWWHAGSCVSGVAGVPPEQCELSCKPEASLPSGCARGSYYEQAVDPNATAAVMPCHCRHATGMPA